MMTLKKKVVQVYNDPGHAWAKVKRSELVSLLLCGEISSFSYQRGDYVYLEEDYDLAKYINALKKYNSGIEIKFKEYWTNRRSKIRDYQSYHSPIRTFISNHFIYAKVERLM